MWEGSVYHAGCLQQVHKERGGVSRCCFGSSYRFCRRMILRINGLFRFGAPRCQLALIQVELWLHLAKEPWRVQNNPFRLTTRARMISVRRRSRKETRIAKCAERQESDVRMKRFRVIGSEL
jgi:hypothetical protein